MLPLFLAQEICLTDTKGLDIVVSPLCGRVGDTVAQLPSCKPQYFLVLSSERTEHVLLISKILPRETRDLCRAAGFPDQDVSFEVQNPSVDDIVDLEMKV